MDVLSRPCWRTTSPSTRTSGSTRRAITCCTATLSRRSVRRRSASCSTRSANGGRALAMGRVPAPCRVRARPLLDNLGGLEEDVLGDGEAERLRGLEVDNQLERRGLLDG